MIRVGIIISVCNSRNNTECLTVFCRKFSGQSFSRCSQYAVIMLILITKTVYLITHIGNNTQSQFLSRSIFSVMFTDKSNQTFRQSDKTYTQSSLINNRCYRIIRLQLLTSIPQSGHQQRKLFGIGRLLKLEPLVKLQCGNLEHFIQLSKKTSNPFAFVSNIHTFYRQPNDIDCRKRNISTPYRRFFSETIFKNAGTTSHCRHFIFITLRIIDTPFFMIIESCIQIQEIRKKTTGTYLTCQFIKVIIPVFRQVTYSTFFLPYLYGKNSCRPVTYTFIRRSQQFTNDATPFGRSIGSVINRTEHNLIASPRMNRIHVMNKSFHRLMHPTYRAVDCMLHDTGIPCKTIKRTGNIVIQIYLIKMRIISTVHIGNYFYFFDKTVSYERS